eukprot:m.372727 g.372727  ORF g.372727 m.372727 type:complete len:55 (+) comp20876_c0_seq8:3494-3658(+)
MLQTNTREENRYVAGASQPVNVAWTSCGQHEWLDRTETSTNTQRKYTGVSCNNG